MRVQVTEECILCGLCVEACPEVFEMGDEIAKVIVDEVPEDCEEAVRGSAEECPSEAVIIEQD